MAKFALTFAGIILVFWQLECGMCLIFIREKKNVTSFLFLLIYIKKIERQSGSF